MSRFQSFLIVGQKLSRREETIAQAKHFDIDLGKISPDIFIIAPQTSRYDGLGHISIEQIRDLKKHIYQKPISQKVKFILIETAERLTVEAQNALLKILEEPPKGTIIILEAKEKSQLLPTIVSRVVVKRTRLWPPSGKSEFNLMEEKDFIKILEKITQIENPTSWLDQQIITFYGYLLKEIRGQKPQIPPVTLSTIIEKCAQTKTLIEANINPKFALFDLIFSLKLTDLQSTPLPTAMALNSN